MLNELRIKLKPTDLHKIEPIIKKHKMFKKNLYKVKHPLSFFKQHCRLNHPTDKGIVTMIAALAPVIISLVQGLISK